jgi:hypothetical protein
VKKAAHLIQPQHAPRSAQWALITDWREAQPLTEVLWTGDLAPTLPFGPPLWTVVLCQSELQFYRASSLASKLKDQVKTIIPVLCERIPVKLFGGIIWKYFTDFQSTPTKVKEKQQRKQMEEKYGECMNQLPTEESTSDVNECEDRSSLARGMAADVSMNNLPDMHCCVHEGLPSSGLRAILLHHELPQQPFDALSPRLFHVNDVDEDA